MATKVITIDNFSGGKNLLDNQLLIQDNQCASGTRNVWAPRGALTKVPGTSEYLTVSSTANGSQWTGLLYDDTISTAQPLYHRIYNTSFTSNSIPFRGHIAAAITPLGYTTGSVSVTNGSTQVTGSGTSWSTHASANDVLHIQSQGVYRRVSSVDDDTHITLASTWSGASSAGATYALMPHLTSTPAMAVLDGKLFESCNGSIPHLYDGTGYLRVAGGPAADFLAVFKNYMFAARTSSAQSRLYWSNVKDPSTWTATDFIDIDKQNGIIMGLFSAGNELLVIKSRTAFKVLGEVFDSANPTYQVVPITVPSHFYFTANYTIQRWRGRVLMYGPQRIYSYIPGTNIIEDVSDKYFQDISSLTVDGIPISDRTIHAKVFNQYYVLKGLQYEAEVHGEYAGIVDHNGAWWFLDDETGATNFSGFSAGPMTFVPPGSVMGGPFFLTAPQGATNYLVKWDFTPGNEATTFFNPQTPGSAAINGLWVSKEYNIDFGHFKEIVIYFKKQSAGNLTIQYSIDQGSFVSNSVDMTAGRGTLIRRTIPINQKGSTIQLKVGNSTASQTFEVYGIQIRYEPDETSRLA